MAKPLIRVLVVDDYEPFRRFARSTLGERADFEVVAEASDGLEAVRSAAELRPDLILLDIGLPKLNGIEAARRIREQSPKSKILFFSENRSPQIVEEALSTGAGGYLLKSDAARELFTAMEALLQEKPFLSSSIAVKEDDHHRGNGPSSTSGVVIQAQKDVIAGHHEVVFYSEDRQLIGKLSNFFGAALNAGKAAVVIATAPHQESLLQSLRANGVDIAAAITQGRYLTADADEAMSHCMVNGVLDSAHFLECFGALISKAADAVGGEHARVAAFGENGDLLLKHGHHEAVIEDEKLGNQLCQTYPVDILCAYLLEHSNGIAAGLMHQICAEHSEVCHV